MLPQVLMRAVLVVMPCELGQDLAEMSLAEDQDVVQHSRRSVVRAENLVHGADQHR